MSLTIPDLDDRTYTEIVENARTRIPAYSTAWTDHNASDPGITILESLAWLAETYTYQLDRVTDAHRLKYLALLGERPRPAQPAGVDLHLSLEEWVSAAKVAEGAKFVATDEHGESYGFEASTDVRLTGATLARVVVDGSRGRLNYSGANRKLGMHYPAFGETAEQGGVFYLGFDEDPFSGSEELSLSVRLHEADLPDPAIHGESADAWSEPNHFEPTVRVEWQHCLEYDEWWKDDVWAPIAVDDGTEGFYQSGQVRLRAPNGWVESIDPEEDTPAGDEEEEKREEETHSVELVDGIGSAFGDRLREGGVAGLGELAELSPERVAELVGTDDVTVSTARAAEWLEQASQRLWELEEPDADEQREWSKVGIERRRASSPFERGKRYWMLRCVLLEDGYEIAPRFDSIAVNVVPVEHRWTFEADGADAARYLTDERGTTESTGLPGQVFTFPPSSTAADRRNEEVLGQTFQFARVSLLDGRGPLGRRGGETESPDRTVVHVGEETWTRRADFDGSGPESNHYVLAPGEGRVRFGDGVRGRIPPEGEPITTTRYVSGGGRGGNLTSAVSWTLVDRWADISGEFGEHDRIRPAVVQSEAATGGTDPETIHEAFDRLVEDRRVPYRAVSLADYEYLATHTPGLRFGRASPRVVEREPVEQSHPNGTGETGESGESAYRGAEGGDGMIERDGVEPEFCEPHREVKVVVVPYSRSARPVPSVGFRRVVECHLNYHRLLTDVVTVEPPKYVTVGVEAEVTLESGYALDERRVAIEDALDVFLDPLHGFEGEGWPFGRTLYRSELYEVIENVAGVDCVTDLAVRTSDGSRYDKKGNVVIEETELFTPGDHSAGTRVESDYSDECRRST